MRQDPGATLDWDVLAEIAGMSRYHFLRVFEELTHASPHRFLIALRIERAKQLLLETAAGVQEVCLKVGYSSVGTFNRIFKELVGIAPGGFRQLAEKLTQSRLQLLLARYLEHEDREHPECTVCADLHVSEPFAGMIVFVGLFNAQLQLLAPTAGAFVRLSRAAQLSLGDAKEDGYVLAIGFSDTMSVNQFFLPGWQSPVAVSPKIPASPADQPDTRTVALNLQVPSIFDFPILVCLPQLLLKLADEKKSG